MSKRKIPRGRTLSTNDKYLGKHKTGSEKKRGVVVIESNSKQELAVVPLSKSSGKNRTKLHNYQDGKSYFKHFVEIEDNEGKPIRIGDKFKENHPKNDVSPSDVNYIFNTVFKHSKPAPNNKKKMEKFRKK